MRILLSLFVAVLLTLPALAQDDESTVKDMFTEKRLPSMVLNDIHGERINISEYGRNGKLTVFSFWATWCTPCKKELSNISYLYEDWQEMYDMDLVAVSIDDERNISKVQVYVDGQAWDYDVLLDTNSDLKRSLNFQTVPYIIIVDQRGNIVYSHSGYVEGDEYYLEEKLAELAAD